jgi:hypothetical protein
MFFNYTAPSLSPGVEQMARWGSVTASDKPRHVQLCRRRQTRPIDAHDRRAAPTPASATKFVDAVRAYRSRAVERLPMSFRSISSRSNGSRTGSGSSVRQAIRRCNGAAADMVAFAAN